MNDSFQRLRLALRKHSINAFLVTDDADMAYLTGYPCQESWLLVCPRRIFYLTDSRYSLDAKRHLKGVQVVECKKGIFDVVAELLLKEKVRRLGFDDRHLVVASFRKLKKAVGSRSQLIATQCLIESLRIIKRRDEVLKMQKALRFHRTCYQFLKKTIRPGLTERQVFEKLEGYVRDHHQSFSFPPIIASGPNSCLPHARISDRKIQKNDIILVDIGIDENGYKSDLTRMFFLGKISHLIKEVYDIVVQANRLAIAHIRPGVPAKEVDGRVRNFLKEKKLDAYFSHSLGHGIGLEVHEAPGLSPKSPAILKEGMVFTVEPGVYFPGQFGIRVEDMVLVTRKGAKILSNFNININI